MKNRGLARRAWVLLAAFAIAASLAISGWAQQKQKPKPSARKGETQKRAPAAQPTAKAPPKKSSTPPDLIIQNGHADNVRAVVFSPDGKLLVSCSVDKTVKVWDAVSRRLIRTLEGHTDSVTSVAFSPDGKTIASGGSDQTIKLWDAGDGRLIHSLRDQDYEIRAIAFSPDGKILASASAGKVIVLWDVKTGELISEFGDHPAGAASVRFSPDGKTLASGGGDKTVKLWEVPGGKLIRTLTGHTNIVASVAFSPNGRIIASGSWDKTIILWDAASGSVLQTLRGHSSDVRAVTFDSDGGLIASASGDKTARIWDVASGRQLRGMVGSVTAVTSVAFSPDNKTIASAGWKQIAIWEAGSGKLIDTLEGRSSEVTSVACSHDEKIIGSGAGNGVALWDARGGLLIRTIQAGSRVTSIAFAPDDKRVAAACADSTVKMWDVNTGGLIRTFRGHEFEVMCACFSPDGRTIAAGGIDKTIRLWDVNRGGSPRTLKDHYSIVDSVAFSPDGRLLASASVDKTLKLWDLKTGKVVKTLSHPGEVRSVAFSSDGAMLVSGCGDKTVRLWDTSTGALISALTGHVSDVRAVAFSPDGALIASGAFDKTVKLWETASRRLVSTLQSHTGTVGSVAFSPGGKTLVSGSADTTAKVWLVETKQLAASLLAFNDGNWLAYTPDGYYTGSEKASQYVSWRVGNTIFDFDQFFDRFFKPGIQIQQDAKIAPAPYSITHGFALPPQVAITSPHPGDTLAAPDVEVTVEAKDAGGGVGEIRLYQNGKVIGGAERGIRVKSTVTTKYRIPLVDGENVLRAIAFSDDRTESRPFEVTVKRTGPAQQAALHLLVFGINRYKNSALDLNFAVPDARSLVQYFKETGPRLFREVDVTELYDADATKTNIMNAFRGMRERARPQDVVIVYFSGHGDSRGEEWYFIPYEITQPERNDQIAASGVSATGLSKELASLRPQKILLLIDACKAGSLLVAFRGVEDRKALDQLARSTGVHVLAASAKDQMAAEVDELGHGVFTYLLLKGLKGEAVQKSSPNTVTVLALLKYVQDELPEISQKYKTETQYPVTASRGMDFPLAVVR